MQFEPPFYECYKNRPFVRANLESAYKVESKTRQFPFAVASELSSHLESEGEKVILEQVDIQDLIKQALDPKFTQKQEEKPNVIEKLTNLQKLSDRREQTREFLIFHDIEHYLNWRDQFPNCHEIIRCPSNINEGDDGSFVEDKEDLCKGRLIFDFDCKKQLSCLSSKEKALGLYVPNMFKQIIEYLVLKIFQDYYIEVDINKLIFVWQITKYDHKFSMHLIVKNAYFNEYWIKQMRIFYELMLRTARGTDDIVYFSENDNGYNERIVINISYLLQETLDTQIPRKNATFRILGCSKIGGLPKEIDSCRHNNIDLLDFPNFKLTIYDCLVGIYHLDHLREEQQITMGNLNYVSLQDELEESLECESTDEEKRFRYVIDKNISLMPKDNSADIDFDDENIAKAIELFESWNEGIFVVRDQVGDVINLDRLKASQCKISGTIHERENAYLKLKKDGRVSFYCRRGCKHNGKYGIDLGIYKQNKRPIGIIPINTNKLQNVQNLKTVMQPMPLIQNKGPEFRKSLKTSSKKVQVGVVTTIQIPSFLRVQ